MELLVEEEAQFSRESGTYDRSNGAAGCEEPPMVCAKLVMEPLLGRGFPRTPLPMGTPDPPPNAHMGPLVAKHHRTISISGTSGISRINSGVVYAYPSFRLGAIDSTRFCFVVIVAD